MLQSKYGDHTDSKHKHLVSMGLGFVFLYLFKSNQNCMLEVEQARGEEFPALDNEVVSLQDRQ